MRLSRILIGVLACLGASPAVVVAQRPPTGEIGGIAPTRVPLPLENARARRRPVFFRNVPVVAAQDGRVFADFGRGFEQVVYPCGTEFIFGGWTTQDLIQPAVAQPTVIQPSADLSQPLPYMPPPPLQPPAVAQQMIPQTTPQAQLAQATASTLVNTQMCWSNDPRGRVFVGIP